MSLRFILSRSFKHGKYLLQQYCFKRQIHTNILENTKPGQLRGSLPKADKVANEVRKNQNLFKFGQNARRLFIDNILNRVTNPVSSEIRADVTKKFCFGDSAPFFALVGVSLASGNGVLTKDDELEGVCMEIRQAVAQYQNKLEEKLVGDAVNENLKLDRLDIGPPISKGCNAVVYAASLKEQKLTNSPIPEDSAMEGPSAIPIPESLLSPTEHLQGRFAQNFGGSVDNLYNIASSSPRTSITSFRNLYNHSWIPSSSSTRSRANRDQRTVQFSENPEFFQSNRSRLSSGSSVDYFTESPSLERADIYRYPLALKMMFNYDVQSNAMAILKAMHKETIPARRRQNVDVENWEKVLLENSICLPPHPNIVTMFGAFCDQVPSLRYSTDLYPMALPPRLNPSGYGRNMSLFLLMKRYNFSLNEFLATQEISMRTRVLLFAQLLEAVAHMARYGVAHRDLKSDNILIETVADSSPMLVISDFGCCLADKTHGLKIPYTSEEITKGGNAALMAPEIINKEPGTFSLLNYTKSDLWACGAIAYEIFGMPNPFYQPNHGDFIDSPTVLRNSNYDESDLPELSEDVPFVIRRLVENMLQRNPGDRLSPDVAANVAQLYLWAPSTWMKEEFNTTSNEILQWLLSLTTKVLCEGSGSLKREFSNRRTFTEYQLLSSFLARARLRSIRRALNWIQSE